MIAPFSQTALAVLDRRLDTLSHAPVVVGFSGGSDSLALLRLTLAWADKARRPVLAVTVDHQLQPDSAAWTRRAMDQAAGLGAQACAVAWTGPKPATGLPAAARLARHRLLAEAARDAGAGVILLGHTADDLDETDLMRQAGSSLGRPREWAPSPVWPQGRGLFILRPLLNDRRGALRAGLAAAGLDWLEDPANADPRYARARARAALAEGAANLAAGGWHDLPLSLARPASWGGFTLDREALTRAPQQAAARALAAAVACASGREAPPRTDRVRALLERIAQGEVTAVLGGARIEAGAEVLVMRETGESKRGGLGSIDLPPGKPVVWDGRYELTARRPGLSVTRLQGSIRRLSSAEHRLLKTVPPSARGALPLVTGDLLSPSSPVLTSVEGLICTHLGPARMAAACGEVAQEGHGSKQHMAQTLRCAYLGS